MKLSVVILCLLIIFIFYKFYKYDENSKQENFYTTQVKKCMPMAIMTLYTLSNCPACENIKPEWEKFKRHIAGNCKYNRIVKIVEKKDDEIDDKSIKYVPSITVKVNYDQYDKTYLFDYGMQADKFERFLIECISNHLDLQDIHDHDRLFATDCEMGKLFGKYYTDGCPTPVGCHAIESEKLVKRCGY